VNVAHSGAPRPGSYDPGRDPTRPRPSWRSAATAGRLAGLDEKGGGVLEIRVGDEEDRFDDDAVVTVGRAESCSVRVDDHRVSRVHLELRVERGRWQVTDLDSANGTFATGRRIRTTELRRPLELSLADPDNGVLIRLLPHDAGETIVVDAPVGSAHALRIGRAVVNDLVLDDLRSSRYHAELIPRGDRAEIRDCASANGTWVNGNRVEHREVGPGDLVEIGDTTMRVVAGSNRLVLEIVAQGATQHRDGDARPVPDRPDEPSPVTARECEVLALVAGGASDKEIAATLVIGVTSVRSHLDRIQQKTGRRRRADLTRLAFELGIEPRSVSSHDA